MLPKVGKNGPMLTLDNVSSVLAASSKNKTKTNQKMFRFYPQSSMIFDQNKSKNVSGFVNKSKNVSDFVNNNNFAEFKTFLTDLSKASLINLMRSKLST
jgi:hypothetical protein